MTTIAHTLCFYLVASFYPLGIGLAWYTCDKPQLRDRVAWARQVVTCALSVAFAVLATVTGDDPWIMLRIFTYDGVAAQLRSPWLVHMCVLHFALGDTAIWTNVLDVSLGTLQWSWLRLAVYLPAMMWCNAIGLFPWLITPSVAAYMTTPRRGKK